jgi:predicted ATPase
MGLHTGEGVLAGDDYVGIDVHRAARIMSAGHGGQILVSEATRALIGSDLSDGATLRDLGDHRLKDLRQPEHLFQVQHPDLPSDFPPLRSLSARPNNLPIQLTSFVDRDQETTDVRTLLSAARLVTLMGVGGTGKTRLALHVAAGSVETFRDGVWLVELASITNPALVAETVVDVLGARQPSRAAADALRETLADRTVLLIMDNCEHVLGAVAELCSDLLRRCPGLRVLATSRESLDVPGEAIYRVPPLSLPDGHALPPHSLDAYAATRLFVERARLYRPDLAPDPEEARTIARIALRLDGIPLAIELAAARTKVLSVAQIADRLDDRFRLLTGGARSGLSHHQTLQAAMDWSYDLLADEERALFRTLAVFAGGFSLDAAESVWRWDGSGAGDILDVLTRLVDKSLVLAEHLPSGEFRYRMLETVRRYALDRLVESGEAGEARSRHRDHFRRLVEEAEPDLVGPRQKAWLDRLELEHDNLRAALEWSTADQGSGEAGLRMAAGLWWFWEIRGYWSEGRRWLRDLLARPAPAWTEARVKALNAAASLALRQLDLDEATMLAEQSLEHARQLGDNRTAASCLVILGLRACRLADFTQAQALGDESLNLSQQVGDHWGAAWAQATLGIVARERRDFERAKSLLEQSLRQVRLMGHQWGVAAVLTNLGLIAAEEGTTERAAAYFEEAADLFRDLGDKSFMAYTLLNLGANAIARSDYARASERFAESLSLRWELKELPGVATCLTALGCVAARLQDFRRAAVLCGAADALREITGASVPQWFRAEYERSLATVRDHLGQTDFSSAWEEGRLMPAEEAVALATGALQTA